MSWPDQLAPVSMRDEDTYKLMKTDEQQVDVKDEGESVC